ncbi:hypothetical protein A6X20_12685 [Bradyrhizobium elkanii]|nr:hypothetical protein A6452_06600 [Bradyrhizobium elkanii]ODM84973.1 hypothetical protein A6X20_12685 [Bradyrhizobium elkanii]
MSRQTHFLVQCFDPAKGDLLKAGASIARRSEESARRTAEKLAMSKAGVVAFSTSSDTETGDYDDQPTVFFRAGRVPAEFDSMP